LLAYVPKINYKRSKINNVANERKEKERGRTMGGRMRERKKKESE